METKNVTMVILILVFGLIALFLITSRPSPRENFSGITTTLVVTTTVEFIPHSPPEELTTTTFEVPAEVPLSELQITACEAADEGGTCFTKLPDLNLVSTEECCKYLGKCC